MRNLFCAAAAVALVISAPGFAQMSQDRMATEAFAAAAEGDIPALESYLSQGWDVNYRRDGASALTKAVLRKRTDVVKFLLSKGANPFDVYSNDLVPSYARGVDVLALAEGEGATEIVRLLRAAREGMQPTGTTGTRPNLKTADLQGVRAAFQRTVKADPQLLQIGEQIARGAAPEAMRALQKYTRQNPDSAEAWYLSAVVAGGMNQIQAARDAFARAVALKPEFQVFVDEATAPPSPPGQPAQAQPRATVGQSGWPKAGDIPVGQNVLFSTSGGERWTPGVVTEIGSGDLAGMVKVLEDPNDGWSGGWKDPSYIVRPQREKFWTDFFVGDWDVNTGGAVNYRTDGRDVYQVVTGGMKVPPLRINADGTYQWRESDSRGKVVTGRWKPRDDIPGIVIMAGPKGTDWTLWNNTTRATRTIHKTDAIRVTGPVYSYDALRLSR